MAQIETYTLKVDSKHQASYDACKGAYILHYMYGPDNKWKPRKHLSKNH